MRIVGLAHPINFGSAQAARELALSYPLHFGIEPPQWPSDKCDLQANYTLVPGVWLRRLN